MAETNTDSGTNINCTNCKDCTNCTNCKDCIKCKRCSNCTDCVNCNNCFKCVNLTKANNMINTCILSKNYYKINKTYDSHNIRINFRDIKNPTNEEIKKLIKDKIISKIYDI